MFHFSLSNHSYEVYFTPFFFFHISLKNEFPPDLYLQPLSYRMQSLRGLILPINPFWTPGLHIPLPSRHFHLNVPEISLTNLSKFQHLDSSSSSSSKVEFKCKLWYKSSSRVLCPFSYNKVTFLQSLKNLNHFWLIYNISQPIFQTSWISQNLISTTSFLFDLLYFLLILSYPSLANLFYCKDLPNTSFTSVYVTWSSQDTFGS